MATVLLTGGTGMVGNALAEMLSKSGYQVWVLTRKIPSGASKNSNINYFLWDIKNNTMDNTALQKADCIIHLAGAGVMDKKWTETYKKEIIDSRVKSASLLVKTLKTTPHQVKTIVSASAIGWYGADNQSAMPFTENAPPDNGFLGETCRQWEQSMEPTLQLGIRLVKYRIGIVLSNKGGALTEFNRPLRFGIAGILGSGKQIISWIHLEDLCRLFIYAIENNHVQGVYNAVAPHPVSNKALLLCLAKITKGKFYIPVHVPTFILKMALGTRSIEVLKSTNVSSKKIESAGFTFLYPTIKTALENLENNKGEA